MARIILAFLPTVCAGFIAPGAFVVQQGPTSRRAVTMGAGPPWSVPGPPDDFSGAQWAPWLFGTTLKPPPTPELRATESYAAPVRDQNNIVQHASVAAPVEVAVGAPVAVAAAPVAAAAVAPVPAAPAPAAPAAAPGTFKVTLKMPDGEAQFDCPPNEYMLDHVDEIVDENEALADLPYACRAGSCSACAAKVLSGEVDNSDGSFLSDEQKAEGFVLTCTTYIKSDVVLQTHAEDDLY